MVMTKIQLAGEERMCPGSDSSPSSQGHGCGVRATAEPQSQQPSQGDTSSAAQGTLPETQAEAGIGQEDCLEAGPLPGSLGVAKG